MRVPMGPRPSLSLRLIFVCLLAGGLSAPGCANSKSTAPPAGARPAGSSASGLPSIGGHVVDAGVQDDTDQGSTVSVNIDAGDNYFLPTYVKVVPGAVVSVTVRNTGVSAHNFTVVGTSIDLPLDTPGGSATATFTMPSSGSVTFYCSFHKAIGMQGAFYVGQP